MSYGNHCASLLDTSRQVLLDGKALVELIHNPQDDIDGILNTIQYNLLFLTNLLPYSTIYIHHPPNPIIYTGSDHNTHQPCIQTSTHAHHRHRAAHARKTHARRTQDAARTAQAHTIQHTACTTKRPHTPWNTNTIHKSSITPPFSIPFSSPSLSSPLPSPSSPLLLL